MNERIRELAEQADIKLDYFGYGVDIDGGNPNVSKFAELIVQECAKCCTSATQEGQPLHLVSLGYAQRIKQHFGVE